MTRLSCSIRSPSRLNFRGVNSRILSLNFFTDFGRMRRERLERVKPKKAYPFAKEVTFVFSRLSCNPSPPSNTCSTRTSASFGLFWSWGENHEIVGITNKAKADAVQLPIQVVQNNGGQQWGYDPTLRSANGGGFEDPNRFDETPLSPNDSAAHPNSWRG